MLFLKSFDGEVFDAVVLSFVCCSITTDILN